MRENEKVFYLYYDWIDDLDELADGAVAWEIVKAICDYHRNGENPVEKMSGDSRVIVSLMFKQIKRREAVSEIRREVGRRGGLANAISKGNGAGVLPIFAIANVSKSANNAILPKQKLATEDRIQNTDIQSFSLSGARTREESNVESGTENPEEAENEEPQNCAERIKRYYLGGTLGQGVILMSAEQFDDLCVRLSLDELERYMEIVVNCERSGKHYKKTHYQAILNMAEEDRKIGR
ncbi:MAG: hypothetical protein IJF33_06725 [Clostridia bacterium]|nr:hypothetical protein [Clostridia bacterium]